MSAELVRSRSRIEVVPADFGQSVLVFVLIVSHPGFEHPREGLIATMALLAPRDDNPGKTT
jgi:hypothetical protein